MKEKKRQIVEELSDSREYIAVVIQAFSGLARWLIAFNIRSSSVDDSCVQKYQKLQSQKVQQPD